MMNDDVRKYIFKGLGGSYFIFVFKGVIWVRWVGWVLRGRKFGLGIVWRCVLALGWWEGYRIKFGIGYGNGNGIGKGNRGHY